jgi:hypothetical protein
LPSLTVSQIPCPARRQFVSDGDSHSWRRVVGLETVSRGSGSRFTAYIDALSRPLGHADRAAPFRSYCAGLLLPGDRKSVEPKAARVEPGRVQATQARARPGSLRGARLARLPSPRHTVHRRIRLPDRRAGSDSPRSSTQHLTRRGIFATRRSPTPRIPRSDLNVMSETRSLQ